MDDATQGLMPSFWNAHFNWQGPWHRAVRAYDRRYNPIPPANAAGYWTGGGRRLRHPFLTDIIYPRLPDVTTNFDQDPLKKMRSAVTKTLDSSAVAKFLDKPEDIVIREIWNANTLSTLTEFFRQLHRYSVEPLPTGRYIGWRCPDLSPKSFAIEILDVQLGQPDAHIVEEIGEQRPYMMRETLQLTFKFIREAESPSGAVQFIGA